MKKLQKLDAYHVQSVKDACHVRSCVKDAGHVRFVNFSLKAGKS